MKKIIINIVLMSILIFSAVGCPKDKSKVEQLVIGIINAIRDYIEHYQGQVLVQCKEVSAGETFIFKLMTGPQMTWDSNEVLSTQFKCLTLNQTVLDSRVNPGIYYYFIYTPQTFPNPPQVGFKLDIKSGSVNPISVY